MKINLITTLLSIYSANERRLRIMKLFIFCLFLTVFHTSGSIYSQKTSFNLDYKNIKVIEALHVLESNSDYKFLYRSDMIDLNRTVNLIGSDKNVEDVLSMIFPDGDASFRFFEDNLVAITTEYFIEQQITITGRVTEAVTGEPLPGVSILIRGTTIGTITNMDGEYSLANVPSDAILVFSFIGMITQEIEVGDDRIINVAMDESLLAIDEVVAVGYQSKFKTNLTGSVATVDMGLLENRPTARFTDILAGTVPGLTLVRNNPGRIGQSAFGIRIGGLVSRTDPQPLIVLDGIPQQDISILNQINPKDVGSVSVLKDSEAVVYGSRAAGGVIVIETKRGSLKPQIGFGYNRAFSTPYISKDPARMLETLEMHREGFETGNITFFGYPGIFKYIDENNLTWDKIKDNNFDYVYGIEGGAWAPFPDTPFMGFGHTDWMDLMYGTATTQNYDFNMSGATETLNYYFSVGYVDEESMLRLGDNTSTTGFFRGKFEYTYGDLLKVGTNIGLRTQNWTEPSRYLFIQNLIAQKFAWDHPYTPEGRYMNWGGYQHPIGHALEGGDAQRRYYNVQAQVYGELSPVEHLVIRANISQQVNTNNLRSYTADFQHYLWNESRSFTAQGGALTNVTANKALNQGFSGSLTANYMYKPADNHTFRALIGVSHEEYQNDNVNAWRQNLLSSSLSSLNLGDSEYQFNNETQNHYALDAFFGNITYSFKDKYILESSYRNDGSSRFAPGYKWKDFYSISGAWNIEQEGFIQNLNIRSLDNLKIRASWGQLGNQSGIALYDFVQQVNISESNILLGPPSAPVRMQTATVAGFPALDRTWEVAVKKNIGIDLGMFNQRINLTGNYFHTDNEGVFYTEEFPTILGATPPSINGAHVETKGWDLSLSWNDNTAIGLNYYIGAGVSDARTNVVSLADSRNINYGHNSFVEGYPVATVFGFAFDGFIQDEADLEDYRSRVTRTPWAFTSQLVVGDVKFKDLTGNGLIEARPFEVDENGQPIAGSGDMINLGDQERHYEYFINGRLNFRGVDFSFVLAGVGSWMQFDNWGQNMGFPWIEPLRHFYGNTWRPDRTDAHYPRFAMIGTDFSNRRNNNNYGLSDAHFMKRNVPYLSVRNIQVGYTIPSALSDNIRADRVYVYFNATDLGYLINKMPKSYSPEQPYNVNITPYPRTFSLGLNVNF